MSESTAQRRLQEARSVLDQLDLPRKQLNDRSALCLLALLDLTPDKPWRHSGDPLMGITPIMDWIRRHYARDYAPNTRETIRRQTMHQFVAAGIALYNPDKPDRPVNRTSLQKTTSTHVEKTTHRRSSVVAELLRLLP
jgi:adenine-specific DNA-methyltransferase